MKNGRFSALPAKNTTPFPILPYIHFGKPTNPLYTIIRHGSMLNVSIAYFNLKSIKEVRKRYLLFAIAENEKNTTIDKAIYCSEKCSVISLLVSSEEEHLLLFGEI